MSALKRLASRDSDGPGWWPVTCDNDVPHTPTTRSACMRDPSGHELALTSHTIGAAGDVSPSVVCTIDGCKFHEFVTLEGWEP